MKQRSNNNEPTMMNSKQPEFNFTPLPIPRDTEDGRYVQSFALNEVNEILQFWNQYGVVVIRDVISLDQCNETLGEIYSILEINSNWKFNRLDPRTWDNWAYNGISKYGQPSRDPIFSQKLLENRQNPNVYQVFSLLLGSENLLVSHDRACLFRPTKGVLFPDGGVEDNPNWKTGYNIHLDINPSHYMEDTATTCIERWGRLRYGENLNHFITENNICHKSTGNVQGVLNLCDNLEEDGGFVCVPGFIHNFNAWYEANQKQLLAITTSPSVTFSNNHWLNRHVVRISMRPGSLVVWDSRTPHGSAPNNSARIRSAQFMKMFPISDIVSKRALKLRRDTLLCELRSTKNLVITPLGEKVLGLGLNFDTDVRESGEGNQEETGQEGRVKGEKKNRIQGKKW